MEAPRGLGRRREATLGQEGEGRLGPGGWPAGTLLETRTPSLAEEGLGVQGLCVKLLT